MATPASAVSDVAEPQPEDPRQAEAAATAEAEGSEAEAAVAAESAGASNRSTVAEAAPADASSPPAPATTYDSAAAPPSASPATPAAPGPPRPQFPGSPAYMAPPALSASPSPDFSYNVLPRAPSVPQVGGSAASLQPGSSPALMAAPMPAAALQPPAPGQYFGNRPSFSYNVVSHANARLPTGQQFQPDTGTNYAGQPSRFVPPGSLQPPAPGQLTRPGTTFPGAMAPNPPGSIQLPFSVPRPSNIPFGASAQQGNLDINTSKSDAPSAPEVSPNTMQLPTCLPSASGSSSIPVQMPTNLSLPPRPEVFGTARPSVPGQPSAVFSNPTSLPGRPIVPSAAPLPQTAPSIAIPGVIPQNSQPPFYSSYPRPGIVPPQPLWGHPHPPQPTGFQQPPFQSYPGPVGSLGKPMVGTSAATMAFANVLPSGVSTGGDRKEQTSTNPGSEQPTHASSVPDSTGNAFAGFDIWDKLAGTDWSIVTTSDGKKYYYDNKQKVSSWQLPPEVAELLKNAEYGSCSTSLQDAATIENKGVISIDASTPAIQTGGRDSLPLQQTVATASPSALDLIKKKLQDAGASSAPSPLTMSSSAASELNGSKPADAALKGQQVSNNGEKSKDNNGDANVSDSSSDSDDDEHGPSKEDCIRQFKEMLKERGVAPFSKWEKELPKIVFDPRFKVCKAIPSHSTRRAIFDHYVRTRADEERKEKRAAQKATLEAYKELLEEASEDINEKTDYQEFKRKWGADPRVKAIQEKVKSMRKAIITDFKSMLRESKDITSTSRWTKVSWTESKPKLEKDPQGRALNPDLGQGDAEKLFRDHVKDLYEVNPNVVNACSY
ncbi:Pre-mRNA-processing protein 40C [Dichanthelium oligosanthes]|uniref:Pre-mRNA-processing protein 40C n=1 Tax=Dichanthelium oligosanthes TaxID=888268 RepID=A0A1E5W5V3_9POAL|nr:Pre-mRNA-processing protein 40C [Dichanthelium oligosanthes]